MSDDSLAQLRRDLAQLVGRQIESTGRALGARAFDAGLAVTLPDGSRRPIPIGAIPVVIDDAEVEARNRIAALLVAATSKAARWRLAGAERAATLAALSPAEQRLVLATAGRPTDVAVARVDFLGSAALEVNATIPAMQGYSDIAAASWLEQYAPASDLDDLRRRNGRNSAALLDALLALHAAARSGPPERIGLLCRRGDSQLSEIVHLQRSFSAAGHDCAIVHPDELELAHGYLLHRGARLSLVYRHLFLHRLDAAPSAAVEAAITQPAGYGTLLLNGPAPHLEMKSTLALLSAAASDDAGANRLQLTQEERRAVATHVPWTRRLAQLDARERAEVEATPDRFVLKRSWSYGGHDVFVGRARDSAEFRERSRRSFADARDWVELCRAAADDLRGDGFIVQRAVEASRAPQLLCTPAGVQRGEVVTDYAAYATLGATPAWTGVCRAAASDIVNIVGGGGVVPLLRRSVAERVLSDAAPHGPDPGASADAR
jgi:hypothetical protein